MKAPLPVDEAERLKALAGYKILDTEAERNFDDITLLASHVCKTPIALICLVDENRQWFKSKIGLVESETSRDNAFCAHGILEPDLFEVEDALADERFATNPLVTGDPKIRFYAGSPLVTPAGYALGMLCVMDQVPRELSPSEKAALKALSRQVVAQLELRRNLAERKQADQALRASEARTRLLVKSSNVGLWDWNLLTNDVFFSPEWKSQIGYADDEVPSRYEEWESRLHPEDREQALRAVQDFREGRREDYEIEFRLRHKDGSWRSILARADLIRGAAGQPLRMLGCHIDISSRKQAEQALRTSDRRFRQIAENIDEVFWVWAATPGEPHLLYVSPAYATIWGRSCESLYSSPQSWTEALHPQDKEWVLAEIADLDLEKMSDLTYRILRSDQSVRWIRDRIFPVRDVHGVVVRFAGIAEDITERKQAEEALAEQAIRYKTLMETSADSTYVLNERGDLQEANAAFLRRRGYTAAEAKGLNVADWDAQWTREQLQELLQEKLRMVDDGTRFETRHRCKDGSVFDVEVSATRVRIGGEQLFFCVTRDITERKQAEQALRESEGRTRLLVKSSNVGLWDWNLLTNEVFFSPEWKSQLGYEDDEVSGRYEEWESRLHPEDRGACLRAVKDFREGRRQDYFIEFRLRHKDGSWRSILTRADLIRGAAGQPLRMMGCHIDITTRKQAEQALRESEERFRELAENINEVFFVWDATEGASRLLYVSPAYATIWGRSCESLYSSHQSWQEALHPDDKKWVLAELSNSALEQINDLTYRIVRPDQSVRWIRDRIFPVRDENGVVVRLAEITVDITENKLAEEELRQVNEQRRDLSRRLFQVQDDERRHLARELHDEIGQALTAAKINVDSIESAEGSTQSLRLKETSTLLDSLLRQVRQISLDLHSSLLDDLGLAPALRSLLDQQARRAGLRAQLFATEPLENIDPEIQTTGFRIAQEAITNVLRHAKAQSVGVHLQTEAGLLQLKIVDDGNGFDLAEVERRAYQGASFGLMGMRERAALVGGRVQIIASPNKGTTIQVSLPLHAPDERPRSAAP